MWNWQIAVLCQVEEVWLQVVHFDKFFLENLCTLLKNRSTFEEKVLSNIWSESLHHKEITLRYLDIPDEILQEKKLSVVDSERKFASFASFRNQTP